MRLLNIEQKELERYLLKYSFADEMVGKTFLITGCKGLVGNGVIKWLLLENRKKNLNLRIIASTRKPNDIPNYIESDDPIEFCQFGSEKEYCCGKMIDYIIHSASPTGNTFHKVHPAQSIRVIIDETEIMLDIAKENPSCKMIYLSSEEIYGLPDSDEPVDETYVGAIDSLTYRSCYPLGKKAAELMCLNYSIEYGCDVKIIRPTVIHGLFQTYDEQRVVNEILRCVVESKNLVMKSNGLTKKCFMYSLDAISAVFFVLFYGKKGEAYNASNPDTFMPVRDLAALVFEKFNNTICVEFAKDDTAVLEGYLPQRSLVQNINKLKSLGWESISGLDTIYKVDIERFKTKMKSDTQEHI